MLEKWFRDEVVVFVIFKTWLLNLFVILLVLLIPQLTKLNNNINPNKMVELYSVKDNYKVIMTENGRVLEPFDVCNLIVNPCSIVVLAKEK